MQQVPKCMLSISIPSPRGCFGGLNSPKQSSKSPQTEISNTIWISGFSSSFECLAPAPTQSPPVETQSPYWKLSGDSSAAYIQRYYEFSLGGRNVMNLNRFFKPFISKRVVQLLLVARNSAIRGRRHVHQNRAKTMLFAKKYLKRSTSVTANHVLQW